MPGSFAASSNTFQQEQHARREIHMSWAHEALSVADLGRQDCRKGTGGKAAAFPPVVRTQPLNRS
jgi:hypothetical protein